MRALVAHGGGAIVITNLHPYPTARDLRANDPMLSTHARNFGVALIETAAKRRRVTFGPVSWRFGVGGLISVRLGIRKK